MLTHVMHGCIFEDASNNPSKFYSREWLQGSKTLFGKTFSSKWPQRKTMAKTVHGASQQWQKQKQKNCTDHPIAITHSMQGLPSGRASCYLGTTSLIIVLFTVLFTITVIIIIIAFSIHHIYSLGDANGCWPICLHFGDFSQEIPVSPSSSGG